jgi:hypothetical protein
VTRWRMLPLVPACYQMVSEGGGSQTRHGGNPPPLPRKTTISGADTPTLQHPLA